MSVPHQPQRLTSPWRPEDLVRLTVLGVVGLSGIAMAWYGVSGQGRLSQQMSWLNLAVLALVLAGAANVAWLTAGRRAVGIRRNELLARWDVAVEPTGRFARMEITPAPGPRALATTFVQAAGMTFAHVASCPLVTNKALRPVTVSTAPACLICRP